MRVEVATPPDSTTKNKGDLLENLASDLLKTQNYEVTNEVRFTATELDLLCTHKVNRKQIYVECKAHRDPLSANVLTNLLGVVTLREYSEGWLISTGSLGKEAKGFQSEWEEKPRDLAQRLSIYTPERVIDALVNAHLIKAAPHESVLEILGDQDEIGEWLLLITTYGMYWLMTCLISGIPSGILVFSAKTGKLITDATLLRNLSTTDTSVAQLDFEFINTRQKKAVNDPTSIQPKVIEVQQGDSWADYRPARPEDFVGRREAQSQIIHFLEDVHAGRTRTRVFAVTGDSGMGKSSLIAKIRERLRNKRYRGRYFLLAVDVRAATNSAYILESLLSCFQGAAEAGFGTGDKSLLRIASATEPLEPDSIRDFLESLEKRGQVICLVFDQFEELYSKPELFEVFEVAHRLVLSCISARSNIVLGFAWKTDTTLQQDHPAYFLWHRLADHRMEVRLDRFTHAEASEAITIFEKEIGQKLRSDLRRQLIENSQGYPWLLKKLSIHVYDQIRSGVSQLDILDRALDIQSLFNRDINGLSPSENTCLRLIAENAPADWYEMLNLSHIEVVRGLQEKRLIIRSGDRLNIYWDIFRQYVLKGTVPSIPLTYLPTSPSLKSMLAVAYQLKPNQDVTIAAIANLVGIEEKTAGNIVRDLVMFGVASRDHSNVRLDPSVKDSNPTLVMQRLRRAFQNHALTVSIYKRGQGSVIDIVDIIDLLRQINPAAQHREKTWKIYADRMAIWLTATGFLDPTTEGWRIDDRGEITTDRAQIFVRKQTSRLATFKDDAIFFADASPDRTIDALKWLLDNPRATQAEVDEAGHRNGARTLVNLRLIHSENSNYTVVDALHFKPESAPSAVFASAWREPVIASTIQFLKTNPTASNTSIGRHISTLHRRNWSESSASRIGGRLRNWAIWVLTHSADNGAYLPSPDIAEKPSPVTQMLLIPDDDGHKDASVGI